MMFAAPHDESTNVTLSSSIEHNSSTTRSRLDDLPLELREMLVAFTPLAMRVILAQIPHFRIRSDDVLRARKLLCKWAAEHGYLDLLKWAHEQGYPLLQLRDGRDVCAAAARGGQLAVLQWLREQKCRWDARTCECAAEGGHLEVLQWADAHYCDWDESATIAAASGGHLHVVQWLHAHDCPWNQLVTLQAARRGHLEVFEWAVDNQCAVHPLAGAAAFCRTGDLRMIKWTTREKLFEWGRLECDASGLTLEVLRHLKEYRPDLLAGLSIMATEQLARVGDLVGLEWARANGCFDNSELAAGATAGGQLEVLKWAQANYFLGGRWRYWDLAKYGHLECLKWAIEIGYPLSAWTCAAAALGGHLNVLQWLRDQGCEWDGGSLVDAWEGGHWEVFDWARQHGCPVNARVFMAASRGGYAEVLQWAFESAAGRIALNPEWCAIAANPEVLKVLRDHGCEWGVACLQYAMRGDLEVLQWAVRNGCPWDRATCAAARSRNNLYLVQWASENGCPVDNITRRWLISCERDDFSEEVSEEESSQALDTASSY